VKFGEESQPCDKSKFAILGRLAGVEELRCVVRLIWDDIVSLERSEEDFDVISTVSLSDFGDGAEEGEKVGFVTRDD